MYFEVVVAGELLVAEEALCHRSVGVVREFVSAEHLLQAEGQVTHLGNTTGVHNRSSSMSTLPRQGRKI